MRGSEEEMHEGILRTSAEGLPEVTKRVAGSVTDCVEPAEVPQNLGR